MPHTGDDLVARATQLRKRALADASQVDPEALREILATPTAPPDAHAAAVVALSTVARERDDVGPAFVDDLATLLGRPSLEDALVLRCLREVAGNDPEAVLECVDAVADRVAVDESDATQAATGVCVELAAAEPTAFVDLTPVLASLLDSETATIRRNAIYVCSQVAHAYPEEVKPVVPQLVEGIADRDEAFQTNALSALGAVASAYPGTAADVTDDLAALATAQNPTTRANAAGLLGDVATAHPEAVSGHVPTLVECLESDDEVVRGNAAAAMVHVGAATDGDAAVAADDVTDDEPAAVEDPAIADDAIPALVECLDDPSPVVRRNACKALGQFGATVARERLASLAASDPDQGVAEAATWALEQLP